MKLKIGLLALLVASLIGSLKADSFITTLAFVMIGNELLGNCKDLNRMIFKIAVVVFVAALRYS